MSKRMSIKLDRDGWTKGLQLSIDLVDENGCGIGYRLAGPKFNGSGVSVLTHVLTRDDAEMTRHYLDVAFPHRGTVMTKINDGGPAFPEAIAVGSAGDVYHGTSGMSLRDWFAGQALSGLASATTSGGVWTGVGAEEKAAKSAYRFADAMLAAREAQP